MATTASGGGSGATKTILYLSVNQDHTCFSAGTTHGFYVFSCDPLKERFHRDWGMGVGIVEMLMRCNILALVGGGVVPKFPRNKVVVWDDYQNKAIAELEFSHDVRGVKIRREIVVTLLDAEVHVYHFNNLNVLTSLYTVANPAGLCALSGMGPIVLGCPGQKVGTLHIERIDPTASTSSSIAVTAHKNALLCIGISPDGSYIATASERGTLVRIFDTVAGKLVREFRRGTKAADITSLNFSQDNTLIVAFSDSGTVHVFDIASPEQQGAASNQARERSIVRFHTTSNKAVVCFGAEKSSVIVLAYDGKYSKYSYSTEKGQRVCRGDVVDYSLFQCLTS